MSNWAKLQEDLTGLQVVKRAKHAVHFQRPDGQIQAAFSGKPCHYLDGGIWKPIDTKLIALGDGYYGCPHSKVKIKPDGTVAVAGKDYAQRVELPSAQTGLLDGDKMVRTFSFGEQRLWVTEDGFRSEIQLNRIPTLTEARKLIASESGTLSKEYLKSLTTATDANGNTHTYSTLSAFRTWLASAAFPVVIDPDFTSATGTSREVFANSTTYSTARETPTQILTGSQYTIGIGQNKWGVSNYEVWRSFVKFDTSSIGSGNIVTQVNLKLKVAGDLSTTDFDLYAVKCDWSSYDPITTGNMNSVFDLCLSSDLDGLWLNTSELSGNGWYTGGNLTTGWVNRIGTTYYGLRSMREYDATTPTGDEHIIVYGYNAGSSDQPVLTVTYTEAAGTFIPINMMANAQSLTGGMRG